MIKNILILILKFLRDISKINFKNVFCAKQRFQIIWDKLFIVKT